MRHTWSMPQRSTPSRLFLALSWLVISLPIWVYLVEFQNFGRVQHNDYYVFIGELADGDGITHDPLRWLNLKSNEHRATLPALVYWLNIALTDGHNLGLTFFSLLLLTLNLVMLVRLLPQEVRSDPWAKITFGFFLAVFCYTPVAAHNVAMGFSGSIWFFANALMVAAAGALSRRAFQGRFWNLWPVLLFGIAAAFSHSTHLVLWAALVAGALFLRLSWRRLALLGAGLGFVATLFALSYESLPYHPEMNTRHPLALLRYAAVYLGSLFSGELVVARTLGLIGITACILGLGAMLVLTRSSRQLRLDYAPWLMIQLYGLGNASLTAIGRSGFGEMQAMSSRYGSLAALFWIGLLTPLGIVAWRYRPPRTVLRLTAAVALLSLLVTLTVSMYARGAPVVERFAARGKRQPVAALAMVRGIHDAEIIKRTVAPWPTHVWRTRDFLKRIGHIPFDREWPMKFGEKVDPALLVESPPTGTAGFADRGVAISDGLLRLGGWAYSGEQRVTEVIVLDNEHTIRSEIVLGLARSDVAVAVHPDAEDSGWEGYATVGHAAGGMSVYLRLADDPKFYRLSVIDALAPLLAPDPTGD